MSKLIYPESGIYNYCEHYIDSCSNYLSSAINACTSLHIPSDFTYYNHLSSLQQLLKDYKNEAIDIKNKLKMTNNSIDNMTVELVENCRNIEVTTITKRDRMIV